MNPELQLLHPYPFEKLRILTSGSLPPDVPPIRLSIGEPQHPAPAFVVEALQQNLQGLSHYPLTRGSDELREAISHWLVKRFNLPESSIDPQRHVLPVNGTREGLFAFAQAVIDRSAEPTVLMPNPFYQIYEGAALLAGAQPVYLNTAAENGFTPDFNSVSEEMWRRCQLLYICTPGNPSGTVLETEQLQQLIELAHKHDFIIASDECYSEIYDDEAQPPPGLLGAAKKLGLDNFKRCVVFHSLSKRSNLPGLRSGFVAGDADVLAAFLQYRTYHGCAMAPPCQVASTRAWQDEAHVQQNRRLYREKFTAFLQILDGALKVERPPAGFYLWAPTPVDDEKFAQQLFATSNVSVLPGKYLSRNSGSVNPGKNYVRMALVAPLEQCVEAADRIKSFVASL